MPRAIEKAGALRGAGTIAADLARPGQSAAAWPTTFTSEIARTPFAIQWQQATANLCHVTEGSNLTSDR